MKPAHRSIIVGLFQRPERIVEFASLRLDSLESPIVRAVLTSARAYREAAARDGKSRYATSSAILAKLKAGLAKVPSLPENKSRRAAISSAIETVRSLAEESANCDTLTDHEFREALDAVSAEVKDAIAKAGLLEILDRYNRQGHADAGLAGMIGRLASALSSSDSRPISVLFDDASAALVDYTAAKTDKGRDRIPTGHPRLDRVTGGGKRGSLWIVAAYTGDGKTQITKDLVYHASIYAGRGCLIVTSEQTRADVRQMLVVRHTHKFKPAGLRFSDVDAGKLSPADEGILRATVADLRAGRAKNYGAVSYWQAPSGTTVSDIRAVAEDTARRHPVDVIMVDHTLLFQPTVAQRSEVGAVSEVIRELKQLALDFSGTGCWVLACHQISREGRDSAEKRGYYVSRDLAGSSEAERSADVILAALRTQEHRAVGEVKLSIVKDRWGPGDIDGWVAMERYAGSAVLPIAGV